MVKIIDFDKEFREYIEKWIEENSKNYGDHAEMEADVIDVYANWLNTPADFIDGICPIDYFGRVDNPKELIDILLEYKKSDVTIPDLLLDSISEAGEDVKEELAHLVNDDFGFSHDDAIEIKMLAVNLLSESDDSFMHNIYVDMLSDSKLDNELAILLVEKLEYGDKAILDKIFEILKEDKEDAIKERYADILVHYPGDSRVFDFLKEMFITNSNNTGLYAAYLGKYNDDRAVDILNEALDWQEISYIDYLEIKQALDELGEEVKHERDFSGDNYYESLKHIEQ